jgi:N-acetyl-anhydromuramyl-L-alanine amidase AmpD
MKQQIQKYAIWVGVAIVLLFVLRLLTRKRAYGIPINYQANVLPRSIWKSYSKRSLSEIDQVVIHHSLTTSGSAVEYAKYHVDNNGWPGIGYHYVISKDGEIVQSQPLKVISFHVSGQNTRSIGICLTGNYDTQQPTEAQLDACVKLIRWLQDKELKRKLEIAGHNQYSSKSCPGRNINVNEIAARVNFIAA